MHLTQTISEPAETYQLLANLNLAIDKARLVQKVVGLSDQLRSIEDIPDLAHKARFIQQEIDHHEDQLGVLRLMSESVVLI